VEGANIHDALERCMIQASGGASRRERYRLGTMLVTGSIERGRAKAGTLSIHSLFLFLGVLLLLPVAEVACAAKLQPQGSASMLGWWDSLCARRLILRGTAPSAVATLRLHGGMPDAARAVASFAVFFSSPCNFAPGIMRTPIARTCSRTKLCVFLCT
jgi:hypothetical protein